MTYSFNHSCTSEHVCNISGSPVEIKICDACNILETKSREIGTVLYISCNLFDVEYVKVGTTAARSHLKVNAINKK